MGAEGGGAVRLQMRDMFCQEDGGPLVGISAKNEKGKKAVWARYCSPRAEDGFKNLVSEARD